MKKIRNSFDVIIIGNGIVGAALACALAEAHLQVLLLDSQPVSTNLYPEKDLRVSSITYGCQRWLNQLEVWEQMPQNYLGAFRTMKVWEKTAELRFDSAALAIPTLGYIVPNQLLLNAIQKKISAMDNVNVLQSMQVESIHFTKENVFVHANEETFKAHLLIGADGAQSWVRKQCQFTISEKPYEHTAMMTHIYHEEKHHECAYQRFAGNDILAFLPLADQYHSALVWSGEPQRVEEVTELSTEDFNCVLQKIWGDELGTLSATTPRVAFPLIARHALRYIQERVALIGDAAHTLHPLAGQGLNLGLLDAQCLASIIIETHKNQRDIGRYQTLRGFERARQWHNQLMMNFVAGNKWLFSQTLEPMSTLRQMGMNVINVIPSLKRKISQFAVFAK